MKAMILAGGLGTRLSEETVVRPKPMVEIGGMPILWHIMKIFSAQGINDFIICLGYKGYLIKEYFSNYFLHMSDVTFDMVENKIEIHQKKVEPWRVTLVDTGDDTMTGGRLVQASKYLGDDELFCFTYGDGVANIDMQALIAFHQAEGRLATVTAVQPPGRFGALRYEGNKVLSVQEKPQGDDAWINGGFFLLSPKVIQYIEGNHSMWEKEPMSNLAKDDEMSVYFHKGFWQPMDTLRDKNYLESLWEKGNAPWKVWA
jgi:glucose-1-phosphate cytidylyltransferase